MADRFTNFILGQSGFRVRVPIGDNARDDIVHDDIPSYDKAVSRAEALAREHGRAKLSHPKYPGWNGGWAMVHAEKRTKRSKVSWE